MDNLEEVEDELFSLEFKSRLDDNKNESNDEALPSKRRETLSS